MGCDIHMYGEELVDGQWQALDNWVEEEEEDCTYLDVPYEKQMYTGRDYTLFGFLAGVREPDNQYFDAKGFPEDACPEVKKCFEQWDCDAHTPSYLTREELENSMKGEKFLTVGGKMAQEQWDELKHSIDIGDPDWDKLYPHCGWTNQEGFANFEVNVPFSYLLNDQIEKILGELPDNGRIVFWFDN